MYVVSDVFRSTVCVLHAYVQGVDVRLLSQQAIVKPGLDVVSVGLSTLESTATGLLYTSDGCTACAIYDYSVAVWIDIIATVLLNVSHFTCRYCNEHSCCRVLRGHCAFVRFVGNCCNIVTSAWNKPVVDDDADDDTQCKWCTVLYLNGDLMLWNIWVWLQWNVWWNAMLCVQFRQWWLIRNQSRESIIVCIVCNLHFQLSVADIVAIATVGNGTWCAVQHIVSGWHERWCLTVWL